MSIPAEIQMTTDKKFFLVPVLLMTIGTGWLLSALGVAPSIDWIWTLGLAMVGIVSIAISGIDKVTVVIAPLFISASCLSVFRQTGRLSLDVEVPILVILAGLLLLVARLPRIPFPSWVIRESKPSQDDV